MLFDMRDYWLFNNLFSREIRSRYTGSVGGLFWALIHPLGTLAIYALVFTSIFQVRLPDLEGYDFTIFVALGLWPWLMFQEGVQRGALSIQANSGLVRKVAFSHELLVYSTAGAAFAVHLAGFVFVLLTLHLFFAPLNLWVLPSLLPVVLGLLLLVLALSLFLSALQVLFPDVEQFLAPAFMMLFYASPVLYQPSMLPDWLHDLVAMNPLAYFVNRIRNLLMYRDYGLNWEDLAVFLGCAVLFLSARWFFNRLSPHFEDFL